MPAKKKRIISKKKNTTRVRGKNNSERKSTSKPNSTRSVKKAFTEKRIKNSPKSKRQPVRTIRRKTHTQKIAANYGWEIVPFVVAVVVAIVVVAQSMQSARQLNEGGAFTIRPTVTHMAGGCEIEGAILIEVRSAERALRRALENLEDSEEFYNWECSVDPQGDKCITAKKDVRRDDRIVRTKIEEIQVLRMAACL